MISPTIDYNQQLAAIQGQLAALQSGQFQQSFQSQQRPIPVQPVQSPVSFQQSRQVQGVNGKAGAETFLINNLPANSSDILLDNNHNKIYMIKKDANGNPCPVVTASFTIDEETEDTEDFVTKKDFAVFRDELKAEIEKLIKGEKNEQSA